MSLNLAAIPFAFSLYLPLVALFLLASPFFVLGWIVDQFRHQPPNSLPERNPRHEASVGRSNPAREL